MSQYITFALLASLQSINLFWLFFILKIACRILSEKVIEDVRSDDEDESELDTEIDQQKGSMNGGKNLKAIESKKMNGSVKAANGHAIENHDSFADAVVEGKKQR